MKAHKPSKSELATMTIWLKRQAITDIKRKAASEERSFGYVLRRLVAKGLELEAVK